MKINYLMNFLAYDSQYSVHIQIDGEIVIVGIFDDLKSLDLVYYEEWSSVTKRLLRNGGPREHHSVQSSLLTTRMFLDGCCEVEVDSGHLRPSNAAIITIPKLSMKEKDFVSNLWLSGGNFRNEMDMGLSVKSKFTNTLQTGVSVTGSTIWRKIMRRFFSPETAIESTGTVSVVDFDFLLKLLNHVIGDATRLIVDTLDDDIVRFVKLVELELTRMIVSGYEVLRNRIEELVFDEKNLLVYSLILGIVPRNLPGYCEAVGAVFETIATEEEIKRKSSLISNITGAISRRQSVNIVNGDEKILFHVEMAEKILGLFVETEMISMGKLPVLLTIADTYCNMRKLVLNKDVLNNFFFTIYGWIVVAGSGRDVVVEDEIGSMNSRSTTPENLNTFGGKFLSRIGTDIVVSIGFNNSTKFAKRLAALIKAKHSSVVPLFLVRKLIEKYARHSIRILPMLMEMVILPCLDSMDYRLRKTSIQPTSEVFKSMNRRFPMTAFHQNRQKFAIGSTQGQVFVYDIRSATKWRILDGHTGAISAVGFDPSGKHLCTYSATDCTVRVWYLASGGVASAGPVVVSGSGGAGSVLSGLLGTTGGKCVQVKQLGATDQDDRSGIKHPFTLIHRIQSVKIRWTSESDILLVRENGEGAQIRL